MSTLKARLAAAAADAFPPTPDIATGWAAAVAPATAKRARWPRRRRGLAIALATLALPAAALAVPEVRRWLGISAHIRVERVAALPPLPASAGAGAVVPSVAAASQQAGFPVQAPGAQPDRIHVLHGMVTLGYGRVLITELRALRRPEYLVKLVTPTTRVTRVRVAGAPGAYFSGGPHEVIIQRPDGTISPLEPRRGGNALAFERDGLVIRIEGVTSLRQALSLARTMRSRSPAGPGSR